MVDRTSRYYKSKTKTLEVRDEEGRTRELRYLERRFLPQAGESTVIAEHTVMDGERPDTVAARYLGDPTKFWAVCDANGVMYPDELTDEAGDAIRIPMPQP